MALTKKKSKKKKLLNKIYQSVRCFFFFRTTTAKEKRVEENSRPKLPDGRSQSINTIQNGSREGKIQREGRERCEGWRVLST